MFTGSFYAISQTTICCPTIKDAIFKVYVCMYTHCFVYVCQLLCICMPITLYMYSDCFYVDSSFIWPAKQIEQQKQYCSIRIKLKYYTSNVSLYIISYFILSLNDVFLITQNSVAILYIHMGIYTHTYIYICVCVCIYLYVHIIYIIRFLEHKYTKLSRNNTESDAKVERNVMPIFG